MMRYTRFLRPSIVLGWPVRALLLSAVLAGAAAAAQQPGYNMARGKKYTLSPRPNYKHCTDPGDATQLTDGQTTDRHFWTQEGTVGWQTAPYVAITVDLGRVEPIAGVSFRTAAGKAGVHWPGAIHVLTSDDGRAYRDVGELVGLHRKANGPWPRGYVIRRLVTSDLRTRGRYVRFLVFPEPGSRYLFCDEVEVFRGPAALLRVKPGGTPVADADKVFTRWRIRRGVQRRFEADVAGIEKAIRVAELPNESVRRRLLGRLAEATQALRASVVPSDRSFRAVLPFNHAHARLFQVQAALWKAQGRPGLVYWVPPTWDPLDPFVAPPKSSSGKIEVHMMRGEYRAAAINLVNSSARPMDLTIRVEGPRGAPLPDYVTVHKIPYTDTAEGRPVAAALPEILGRGECRSRIPVCPGLLRQVWLTFHGSDLPAGQHIGAMVFRSQHAGELRVPFRLRVYPLDFPEQTSLLLGGWSYTDGNGHRGVTLWNRKALVKHLRGHFVNAPWATGNAMMQVRFTNDETVRLDTRTFDDWIAQWPDAKRYMVFLSVGRTFAGAEIGTPKFDRRVGAWISAWVRHLKAQHVGPERLGLLLQDEPHEGTDVRPLLAWARAIRAAEPEVLIWEDPTYRDPTKAPAELFEVCDVLCPNRPKWLSQGKPFARFYLDQQRRGRELQFYSCSGPARLLDPYSYYRLQAWHCWQVGATGSFFWAFGDNNGVSSWNPYLATAGPYTPLFLDDRSVVAGKHMEAIRESVEDYECLMMLRGAVEKAKAAGRSDAVVSEAERLLTTAANEVLGAQGANRLRWHEPKDRTVADRVRVQILKALTTLQDQR